MNANNDNQLKTEKARREAELNDWAKFQLNRLKLPIAADFSIVSASDDASFRRYFRGMTKDHSYIFVDAPPDREDNQGFVKIAKILADGGLTVPSVISHDFQAGFLMLSDLGNELMLERLKPAPLESQVRLYQEAMSQLTRLSCVPTSGLPAYDEAKLRQEMSLFPDWFLTAYLDYRLDDHEQQMLKHLVELLVDSALRQPQGFVHRDFHSRNLMLVDDAIALIDFQDAVAGPMSYDLVSLLKDCYWRLPASTIEELAQDFYAQYVQQHKAPDDFNESAFIRGFHLMGLQRHLKCAGIFCRLNLRDGKPGYMSDIPLVIDYMIETCEGYLELREFGVWLKTRIQPAMAAALASKQ